MSFEPSPSTTTEQIKQEPMELERKPWYADLFKQLQALWYGLAGRGPKIAFQGLLEMLSRWLRGAPIRHFSEINSDITISGQYQRRGWAILARRGITAVINMRTEWDDQAAGIAPARYLHLKVIDNTPPSLEMLQAGVDFIRQEVANGGKVYIHCAAGVGRAPTMGAAYLISTGMSPDDAIMQIRSIRPFIRPTPEQIAQLHAYDAKLKMSVGALPETPLVDLAVEMAVSTAKAESTVPIATEVPVKPVQAVPMGEGLEIEAAEIQAKDVPQAEGGAKTNGSEEKS